MPLEILLSAGRFDAAQLDSSFQATSEHHECHPHCDYGDHAQLFGTWSYETDQPLSLDSLREAARRLPASIYRCKGVVFTTEEPARRAVLQVVGKRVDISLEDEWGNRTPRTQIVAIGIHDTMEDETLRQKFDQCRAEPTKFFVSKA